MAAPAQRVKAAPLRRALQPALGSGSHDRIVPRHFTMKAATRSATGPLVDNRLAVPRRSTSRAGSRRTADPTAGSMRHVIGMGNAVDDVELTVSVSYGVLPMRKSPPPDSGLRSMRRSAARRQSGDRAAAESSAVPFNLGQLVDACAVALDGEGEVPCLRGLAVRYETLIDPHWQIAAAP